MEESGGKDLELKRDGVLSLLQRRRSEFIVYCNEDKQSISQEGRRLNGIQFSSHFAISLGNALRNGVKPDEYTFPFVDD
ncbi:hypothetical protein RHMOL_Rhmol13G0270600 [Rhododendron molle]|uniref:Uncharacterized protein n=1 Tax=Rhododendron molle TaxID=49168 RepID=A0ACC0LCA4_RHOML|nr:hypothetical protein RHMOL_Rhmol13G0270600 [Rhododendron molle]